MERLMQMKEALINCVESQIHGHLKEVDTKELGEAVDMIKDLSEAIYYCTITEAMEQEGEKETRHGAMYYDKNNRTMYAMPYPMDYRYPMYYDGGSGGRTGGGQTHGGAHGGTSYMSREKGEYMTPYRIEDYEMIRDPYEGKSGWRRKMYMEGKHSHKDKTQQMQDLENYMQELANDMTEMIADATPEEKQLLQQKIAVLASKIK